MKKLLLLLTIMVMFSSCEETIYPPDKSSIVVITTQEGHKDTISVEYYNSLTIYGYYYELKDDADKIKAVGIRRFSIISTKMLNK